MVCGKEECKPECNLCVKGYDTEKQYGHTLHIDEMHWITTDPWGEQCRKAQITFKNRHTPEFFPATLTRLSEGDYVVESERKVQGIAPGQFCVIYDRKHEICLGSGIITGRPIEL